MSSTLVLCCSIDAYPLNRLISHAKAYFSNMHVGVNMSKQLAGYKAMERDDCRVLNEMVGQGPPLTLTGKNTRHNDPLNMLCLSWQTPHYPSNFKHDLIRKSFKRARRGILG